MDKKNIFPFFLVLIIVFPFYCECQINPVLNAGNINSVQVGKLGISFTTDHAFGEITAYSANIIRVRLDKKQLGKNFSYAVIAEPKTTRVSVSQNDNGIMIITDSVKMFVRRNQFAITYYTLNDSIINQDEEGLSTSWVGEEVTTYKKMQDGERFIGLGEKTGNLDRKGNGYTNWNTDAFGYSNNQDPIYSSIPFYIGIHHNLNYGIFFDNTFQTDFNFGASNDRFSSFAGQGGEMDYYFIYNKRLADIITSYTDLTGRMNLPPLWSLGYQQNRYSYYPETEVLRIAQTLREKKIPADGITLDIHYMDNYKLFTWNKERFPDPLALNKKLAGMGFRTTVIVDPGIKIEKGYGAYDRGIKANIFLKYPDSTNYAAQVWPGWCNFPDFTSDKGRKWWQEEIRFFANSGVGGIWNDMNEIATWGQKMPSNILYDYDGFKASNKQGRNVYAMQMARASYDGARSAMKERPFNLTRAGFAGLQRFAAIWTGDNRSEYDHMLVGIRLLNSLGVSGIAFTGMDIGGFTGNPSVELYSRWIQLGAFTPYFRNHTAVNTKSSEPWTFGEEVLEIARNYISLRYKLLPYLYSTFYEATQNGLPVMRTLAIENTFDDKVYDTRFQNQYFFGQAFMIAPFEAKKDFGNIYFPNGEWYDLYTDELTPGNNEVVKPLNINKLPVFVKGGSIIPQQSLIQSTAEVPSDTLIVHIYIGNSENNFLYYEDDGKSFDYEKGNYFKRNINYNPANRTVTFNKSEGSFKSKFNALKLIFHGYFKPDKINGNMQLTDDIVSFLNPISKFDPQGLKGNQDVIHVKSLVIKNSTDKFTLTY